MSKQSSPTTYTNSTSITVEPDEASPLINLHKAEDADLIFEPTFFDYKNEMGILFNRACPLIFAYFLQSVMPLVGVFSIGHLGSKELGAAALSNMFAAITGWSLSIGMSSSLDTLCSQSFTGSKDPHSVGLHLQRGILVCMVMFIPIGFIWLKSEYLMLLLGQDPELAMLCGVYMRYLLAGAPALMTFECIKKFLQAQKIMRAQTYIILAVLPFNFFLNYFLILYPSTSLGFKGAPIASSLTYWLILIFGVLYIAFIDGAACWGGWSRQSLTGWWIYIKLGIPGILQICSEWWAFEIMSLAASYLGTNELAAQSVILSITNVAFSVSIGQGISASNRVGNLIGAAHPRRAELSTRCAIILGLLLPNINVILILCFREQIGYLFTSDQKVLEIIQTIMPVAALYQIFDSVGTVCGGILRGQGRQKIGAVVNLFAFYGLAIPLGLFAAFNLGYGAKGIWLGTCLALSITSTTLTAFVLRSDWAEQVATCRQRLSQTGSSNPSQ